MRLRHLRSLVIAARSPYKMMLASRFELLGHRGSAAGARQRAMRAREALRNALAEQAETKARRSHLAH